MSIDCYLGDRAALRPLFELAEDSARELDSSLHRGRVLVARCNDGEVLGHLHLVDTDRAGEAEVENMAVRADRQGFRMPLQLEA